MANTTEMLRARAESLGFDLFGVVPAKALEEHVGTRVDWMDWTVMESPADYLDNATSFVVTGVAAPGPQWDLAVYLNDGWTYSGYYSMEMNTWRLADDLRAMGHAVYAHPKNISRKILARLAGFGAWGKNSLILHPQLGPRFRIATFLTDAVLDYDQPAEDDFCGDCTACIDACPTRALSPYRIHTKDCLVNHLVTGDIPDVELLERESPSLAPGIRIMCRVCQEACPVGGC